HRQLEASARTQAPVAARDRRTVRHVEPDAAAEVVEALAVDVGIRRVVLEPQTIERPEQVGRAVEARAAEAGDRAIESALEHGAGALDAGGDVDPRAVERFATMLEAVAQDLRTAQAGFRAHEERSAGRTGDEAEGRGVPAPRHAGEQLLEPGGVGVDGRL